jgi:hypothetical protein
MLDLIARYKHLIKSFHVLLYEQERESFRFKAQVIFTDSSNLYVKEYLFENKERKYSYHWSDSSGNLICRWDNADHWIDIPTHPHHKHIGDDVFESIETSIEDVLSVICDKIDK